MTTRTHADRCPGVLRPWIADDGAIVRLRLVGGMVPAETLRRVLEISAEHADGTVLLTKRTNLQLRGIAHSGGQVAGALVEAITDAGLLPSRSHELVRNIMMSPLTGRVGGLADLRGLATDLDEAVRASPALAELAGRFLFVLDDGRGDVSARGLDLGAMAVSADEVQLRVGSRHWGPVVGLDDAVDELVALAHRFLSANGGGDAALWHVDELPDGGASLLPEHHAQDLRTRVTALPLPFGTIEQDDGRRTEHVAVADGVLTPDLAEQVLARSGRDLVVSPWRSLLLPDLDPETP